MRRSRTWNGQCHGPGTIGDRIGALRKTAIIPKRRIPRVFEAALAECRRRSVQHIKLPPERVEVRYPADPHVSRRE